MRALGRGTAALMVATAIALSQAVSASALLSLDVGSPGSGTLTAAAGASSAAGGLAAATWSDTTGSGAGWNGTVATTLFNYTGAWITDAGTDALANTASAAFTGSGNTFYTATVSGCTFSNTGSTFTVAVSGNETATVSVTLSLVTTTTTTIGTMGVSITWISQGAATACPYLTNDAYTVHVGNLATTALTLADGNASATVTAQAGTTSPAPTFVNLTAAVAGGTPSTPGAAVKFVSAALGQGAGTYVIVPYASVTLNQSVWAATYAATLTYTIVSGP